MHAYAHFAAVATHHVKEGLQDNISDNGEPVAAVGYSVRLAIVKAVALVERNVGIEMNDMWMTAMSVRNVWL